MRKMKSLIIHLSLVLGVIAVPLAVVPTVGAVNVFEKACPTGAGKGSNIVCSDTGSSTANAMITDVTNLLFYVIGIIAVIVIIIAGIKYVTSDGDSAKIKSAKETILYAVIGLVVAMLAFAIVTFVVKML